MRALLLWVRTVHQIPEIVVSLPHRPSWRTPCNGVVGRPRSVRCMSHSERGPSRQPKRRSQRSASHRCREAGARRRRIPSSAMSASRSANQATDPLVRKSAQLARSDHRLTSLPGQVRRMGRFPGPILRSALSILPETSLLIAIEHRSTAPRRAGVLHHRRFRRGYAW
jgi:hypothetical protein